MGAFLGWFARACHAPLFTSLLYLTLTDPHNDHTTPTNRRDTLLFNDTIFYNIAYGNLAADEHAVQAAAMCVSVCTV